MYGPVRTVVWQGSAGDRRPYADHVAISESGSLRHQIVPFFAFPADIRKVIYTTNAVESLNMTLRKVIKTRGSFPNEESAIKLLYLALLNVAKKWHTIQNWPSALNHFAIQWEKRFPLHAR